MTPGAGGVGLAGPPTVGDAFATLISQWNTARYLSLPAGVRHMVMLRQQGQGGTYPTEAQALKARMDMAASLPPGSYDWEIDVLNAGFNAFERLVIRSHFPPPLTGPAPDLSKLPAPAPDLNTSDEPQPFSEWIRELSPAGDNGVGSQWEPLPSDKKEIGATWSGVAKRTSSFGTYQKCRFIQNAIFYDRWVRTA